MPTDSRPEPRSRSQTDDASGLEDPDDSTSRRADPGLQGDNSLGTLPEFFRKAIGLGLSGFFLTESTLRKALGDTLPKDWTDFAIDQSERTRAEFLERVTFEMGRSVENIDYAAIFEKLLEGRTIEINASIRLGPRDREAGATKLRVSLTEDEERD